MGQWDCSMEWSVHYLQSLCNIKDVYQNINIVFASMLNHIFPQDVPLSSPCIVNFN